MQNIRKLVSSLGIHTKYKGFRYIPYALELCLRDEEYMHAICKRLYVDVGKKFDTQPRNVEHCIRTAIEYCWQQGNRKLLIELAGYQLRDKPTNSEFISILYQYLLSQEE